MRLFLICLIMSIGFVFAYTAPSFDSVDLVLDTGYTAPDFDSVDLVLGEPTSSDSCTYTGGNWEVDCSDNCTISSNVDVGGNNISIIGTGTFLTTANITGHKKLHIEGTDALNICRVKCDGGCFVQ